MKTEKPVLTSQSNTFNSPMDINCDLRESILRHLRLTLARHLGNASKREIWMATCYAVRDRVIDRFIETQQKHNEIKTRRVYYLSLEYLMGRLLNSNLCNVGVLGEARSVLNDLGYDLDE